MKYNKNWSTIFLMLAVVCLPVTLSAQLIIDSFDSLQDTNRYQILTGSAGNSLTVTVSQDTVAEGQAAFRCQWRVQANSFAGIWTRMEFWHPDSNSVWDLSPYLNLRFSYFNAAPSSQPGYVKLQFYCYDASHAPNSANRSEEVEVWLLDIDILDSPSGWKQIELPLRQSDIGALEKDKWLQSPLGISGNGRLDLDKIRGFAFAFVGSASLYLTDSKSAAGVLFLDDFRMVGQATGDLHSAVHIVVLGSSTAEGTGPTEKRNAWVNRYRTFLKSENANHRVDNLARGGYTTYHILPTGQATPANRPKPDPQRNITYALSLDPNAIIINLPSNDATSGYTVAEQLANYDTVLAVAGRSNIPVWIATTQPRNLSEAGRKNLMEMRDSTLARFGQYAIDFWSELAQPNGTIKPQYDSGDGVHLNDAAHEILFQRVQAKDIPRELFSAVLETDHLPQSANLLSNYPNPFNVTTRIEFELITAMVGGYEILNLLGQPVVSIKDRFFPAGRNQILFQADGLASGIYLYQIRLGQQIFRGKMTCLK
jgi:lysophospholipase L1-like esterase